MHKKNILDLSFDEFCAELDSLNEKLFRAKQVFDWLYKKGVAEFSLMKNLPQGLKDKLNGRFSVGNLEIQKTSVSKDKTAKILFRLNDGESVETVIISTAKRVTVCVSTQVGCKFGCSFCASGIKGFTRNLSCAEILGQLFAVKRYLKGKDFTHVVFMGIGEPLDNYESVLKATRAINSKDGFGIAARRITISTSGLIKEIKRLMDENLQIELSVSLHAADNGLRSKLMPVNKKNCLDDLINVLREYCKKTKRQVTFEYVLIKDVTCTEEQAKLLKKLLRGLICKINLIPYNEVAEFDYKRPSRKEIDEFKEWLEKLGIHHTLRAPRGQDVNAACGQLRQKQFAEEKEQCL